MSHIKLFHYSSSPVKRIIKRNYLEKFWFVSLYNKPLGFWLSVEDTEDEDETNWMDFCDNSVMRHRIKYKYEITIDSRALILRIETEDALVEFVRKYGFHRLYDPSHPHSVHRRNKLARQEERVKLFPNLPLMHSIGKDFDDIEIDWLSLYKNYQGIWIAPYHYKLRENWIWYNGWDVASACI